MEITALLIFYRSALSSFLRRLEEASSSLTLASAQLCAYAKRFFDAPRTLPYEVRTENAHLQPAFSVLYVKKGARSKEERKGF